MGINWNAVRSEHIHKACELFDAGAAIPSRPALTTFLVLNGRCYPAKFIRGLAHKLATGTQPTADEYAGGLETVAFFRKLGFDTEHRGTRTNGGRATPTHPTPSISEKKTQKQALLKLLQQRFGTVQQEAKFDWLTVPDPNVAEGLVR